MSAKCCGGEWDLFFNSYIHKPDCPTKTDNPHSATERVERERRVDHIVNNVFGFPIGGNSRRHNRRLF